METVESEVESFLTHFKLKLSVFRVIFVNRDKNLQGLLDLEINPAKREKF